MTDPTTASPTTPPTRDSVSYSFSDITIANSVAELQSEIDAMSSSAKTTIIRSHNTVFQPGNLPLSNVGTPRKLYLQYVQDFPYPGIF